jgi:hypothetical protein
MADLGSMPLRNVVVIETSEPGVLRRVGSVREAAECLVTGWPATTGTAYRTATKACYVALSGHGTADEVCVAFAEAAREAGIYVRTTPVSSSI